MDKLLTRNGVCRQLEYSPYNFTVVDDNIIATFNFSSKLHLDKFKKERKNNYAMIYNHIYKRFKFKINCVLLADFNLYKKIENRGCYIKYNNQVFTDYSNIKL